MLSRLYHNTLAMVVVSCFVGGFGHLYHSGGGGSTIVGLPAVCHVSELS